MHKNIIIIRKPLKPSGKNDA
ncbi:Protein of unknown function [Bacillus cytotoxicus]|nr:Protein of unknown function [Bacillus cytotoxicus]